MLDWKIEISEGQALLFRSSEVARQVMIEPEEVYSSWPQLKMAVQMLGRLPEGGARKNFENQVGQSDSIADCSVLAGAGCRKVLAERER